MEPRRQAAHRREPHGQHARVVEVELKKPPSGKPFRTAARDPLKVNPKNVTVEFENEYVRVLRCKYPANVREPPFALLAPLPFLDARLLFHGARSRKRPRLSYSC